MSSLGPTLPELARQTQTQLSQISFLFVARSLGYLAGSFAGGRLYDRVCGHPVMAVALVMMAIAMAVIPLTPALWLLGIMLVCLGVAAGALDVGGNTLLVWVHRDGVGPFMNGLHFFFGLGSLLSPIVIAWIVLISGEISWAYWTLALLAFPIALWMIRLPSPARQVDPGEPSALTGNRVMVALIVLFLFFYAGAEISFGGWIFTYSVTLGLMSKTTAAYLTSAFWGSFTLGRLLAIPIGTRVKPVTMLLGTLVVCLGSISMGLMWSGSSTVLWVSTIGVGLSMATIFPTTISLAQRQIPITGQITGWFFIGASAGGMFLPWMIGQLFERIGPQVMMSAILLDLSIAMVVLALILLCTRIPDRRQHEGQRE